MSFSVDGMCSASTVYSLMGKFEDKEKLSKVPKEESEKKRGGEDQEERGNANLREE